MSCLVRFITRGRGGAPTESDKHIDADVITIGRATDQTLHVRDRRARLQHARIERGDAGYRIVSTALAGVTVNGRSQREAELAVGDVIEIGSNVLCVIEPPAGVDFAVSFELREDAAARDLAPAWSAPPRGLAGFSLRRLSWIAAAIVLVTGLALPLIAAYTPQARDVVRALPLVPDDSAWLAGPVHEKHAAVSVQCEACHVRPFERVPDTACMDCHSVERHVRQTSSPVLGEMRCASCHLEHNEPPQLVRAHQGLCADCHADPPVGSDLPPATDFLDAHPPFRVSLLEPTGSGADTDWQIARLLLAEAATAERSNLRFDHAVHVADEGVLGPDGRRTLECADCHVPEPGGAGMQPVTMDTHCSGCHTLAFDPADPSRTVPHGDPEGVMQVLTEYYSARLLGDDPAAANPRLRRPGQALTREDRDRVAAEARARAMSVAADLFERRACATCHDVTRVDGDGLPWRVEPVRLTQAFFPHARFSHAAHDTEVTACESCHAAATSTVASDLLMPAMESCRDCHGSGIARRNSAAQTESTCILCHQFHVPGRGEHP